jgi:hypothetical protein
MKIQQLLFLLLFITPVAGWSQYSSGNSLGLTVYANILQEDRETAFFNLTNGQIPDHQEAVRSLRFGHFSPALSIFHSNHHLSEIELAFLSFDQEDVMRVTELSGPFPGTTRTFSLGLRYAFNFNLLAGQKAVVQPHFGLSVLPYVHTRKSTPDIKALYTTSQTDLGVLGQFISRLIIRLSDFVYLDLNAPVTILDAKQQTMQLQDGGQYLPDIKKSRTELRWLPKKVHLRVGVGVVF